MLSFDFDYYKPVTLKEAVQLLETLEQQEKKTMVFSGGTELITLGRIDLSITEAVIDIKDIQECRVMGLNEKNLVLGSALSLTKIEKANLFPLLTKVSSEIADHTARGKITLGGNICAKIFYREAVLPFLLTDSQVIIAGAKGIKVLSIHDIFHEELQLEKGDILLQLETEKSFLGSPFLCIKRRQQWNSGYPLITICALKVGNEIRVAISGFCPFPFRSKVVEEILNNDRLSLEERINTVIEVLPGPILNDVEGSSKYRVFVLKNLLREIMMSLKVEV
ncbi:MAG: FAD binding domain-containing protein [Bacillota bacterium]|nr:FAD binding domain-containing protein [Bacillota bacterium]